MDNYTILNRIGQGSYGVVLKARNKKNSEIVALKKVNLRSRKKLDIMREFSALRSTHHKNIIHLLDIFCSIDTLTMVMEYVENNLKNIIVDDDRPRTEVIIRYIHRQLLIGLRYLHRIGIMHRDIKPENILVSPSNVIKIADFGQACIYVAEDAEREYEEEVATRWYRAPELLFGSRSYNQSVDIWAAGCILGELWTRHVIFAGRNDIDQIAKIFEILGTPSPKTWPSWTQLAASQRVAFDERAEVTNWGTIVPGASDDFQQVLRAHLRLCQTKRASAAELLKMPFFMKKVPKQLAYSYKAKAKSTSSEYSVTETLSGLIDIDLDDPRLLGPGPGPSKTPRNRLKPWL